MSDEHRENLAVGRRQGNAVRSYLEALDAKKPKRGRKRTPESVQKAIDKIDTELDSYDPLTRVLKVQEGMDLEAELQSLTTRIDISTLEDAFVAIADDFSERKGVSHKAWRAVGVPADILERAGVKR